jgi:glycosyltransferase involved in cell wall biosynthesis
MRIAVVHPWFLAMGGAEATVDALAVAFPEADIKCLLFQPEHLPIHLLGRDVRGLDMNWLPGKFHWYRHLLPYWPSAVEMVDLRGYDLVVTSDSNIMKGVDTDQGAVHICYCHTPMRCLWDLHLEYYNDLPALVRPIFKYGTHYVRSWDFQAAQRVDHFVANSRYVQTRIRKYYRRDSSVIYPPVESEKGYLSRNRDDYYLWVGRLTATKRIDLLVAACKKLGRRLVVAGAGREYKQLKALAGPTIEFLGRVRGDQLPELYANCRAFLFAGDEDFGIVPVEAQSYGRPVIAYRHGGSLETVRVNDPAGRPDTGTFFEQQTVESVVDGIVRFEQDEYSFDPAEIRRHSLQFDTSVFIEKFRAFVDAASRDDYSHGRIKQVYTTRFAAVPATASPHGRAPRKGPIRAELPGKVGKVC